MRGKMANGRSMYVRIGMYGRARVDVSIRRYFFVCLRVRRKRKADRELFLLSLAFCPLAALWQLNK